MCPHNYNHLTRRYGLAASPVSAGLQTLPALPGVIRPQQPSASVQSTGACSHTRRTLSDPEHELNPRLDRLDIWFGAFLFACLGLVAITCSAFSAAWEWFRLKRVCAWCKVRIGGNPATRRITHGICPRCAESMKQQIATLNTRTATN